MNLWGIRRAMAWNVVHVALQRCTAKSNCVSLSSRLQNNTTPSSSSHTTSSCGGSGSNLRAVSSLGSKLHPHSCVCGALSEVCEYETLFYLPPLQMFPECGTEIFVRRPALAASYRTISGEATNDTLSLKRFSLVSWNQTFLTVPYSCLWAKVYTEPSSVVTTVVSN